MLVKMGGKLFYKTKYNEQHETLPGNDFQLFLVAPPTTAYKIHHCKCIKFFKCALPMFFVLVVPMAAYRQKYPEDSLRVNVKAFGSHLCFTYSLAQSFRGDVRASIGEVGFPLAVCVINYWFLLIKYKTPLGNSRCAEN
jgi:hypothetical protein